MATMGSQWLSTRVHTPTHHCRHIMASHRHTTGGTPGSGLSHRRTQLALSQSVLKAAKSECSSVESLLGRLLEVAVHLAGGGVTGDSRDLC